MTKYNELAAAYRAEADRVESLGETELAKQLRMEADSYDYADKYTNGSFDGYYHPKGMRRK